MDLRKLGSSASDAARSVSDLRVQDFLTLHSLGLLGLTSVVSYEPEGV